MTLPTAPQGTVTQPSHNQPANRTAPGDATKVKNSGEAEQP